MMTLLSVLSSLFYAFDERVTPPPPTTKKRSIF